MTNVTVTVSPTDIRVSAPYDATFPPAARKINGKWNQPHAPGVWMFDIRDEGRVRQLCRDVYGTDGSDADQPRVTLRVPVPWGDKWTGGEFRPAGQALVWRGARDVDVRFADGVVVVAGGFPGSGGSMRYPHLEPQGGTVIEVRDLLAAAAQKIVDTVPGSVVVDTDADRRQALIAERATLLARVAAIDAELNAADNS